MKQKLINIVTKTFQIRFESALHFILTLCCYVTTIFRNYFSRLQLTSRDIAVFYIIYIMLYHRLLYYNYYFFFR